MHLPHQYATKNKVNHPTSVYLREKQLLPQVDASLSRKFHLVAFMSAVREFEAARPEEPEVDENARQEIAECDAQAALRRTALEARANPVLAARWMRETQARRALMEARFKEPTRRRRRRVADGRSSGAAGGSFARREYTKKPMGTEC
jgi:site-specific DNA recombinase